MTRYRRIIIPVDLNVGISVTPHRGYKVDPGVIEEMEQTLGEVISKSFDEGKREIGLKTLLNNLDGAISRRASHALHNGEAEKVQDTAPRMPGGPVDDSIEIDP
jgi:hypothetical protein